MLSFWGLFRGKRTWVSREDQGTLCLRQSRFTNGTSVVSSLPGTMTPRSIKSLDIFGLYSDEQRTVTRHIIHLLVHCVKKNMLFGSFSCLMTIMSKRPMSSIFVSNPLNDDSRLFAFPIRLFENTIHPAPLAGSCQHPLLENPLFADYTAYTYVFFCYAPMIPHVSSKSVVCFHTYFVGGWS